MSTIVAIDDNPAVLALLERCLRIDGHQPVMLSDGLDVERIRRASPDLVILDMRLPGRSGLEVLAAMRDDEALKEVPVVLISGVPPNSRDLDKVTVLTKPFDVADLSRQIQRLLRQPPAAKGEGLDAAPGDDHANIGILGAVAGKPAGP